MIFNHLAHISSLGYFKNIFSIYFFKYSCTNNFFIAAEIGFWDQMLRDLVSVSWRLMYKRLTS